MVLLLHRNSIVVEFNLFKIISIVTFLTYYKTEFGSNQPCKVLTFKDQDKILYVLVMPPSFLITLSEYLKSPRDLLFPLSLIHSCTPLKRVKNQVNLLWTKENSY